MITCHPTGLISWNYRIELDSGEEAAVKFATFREQAEIMFPGESYQVTKDGFLSGKWTLVLDNQAIATAIKPNPFIRRFEVSSDSLSFGFGAASILTRKFYFNQKAHILGTLAPVNIFTRRTIIDCPPAIPIHLQLFCLTLAVFLWRRAARSSNS